MRSYVFKHLGEGRDGKIALNVCVNRDVGRELYEVLIDGASSLLIDVLTRTGGDMIGMLLNPLADDRSVSDIRSVIDTVYQSVTAKTWKHEPGSNFFASFRLALPEGVIDESDDSSEEGS